MSKRWTFVAVQLILLLALTAVEGSVSVLPVVPTYTIASAPPNAVVTAHSHQVVLRNYNRLYLPTAGGTVLTGAYPATSVYPVYGNYPYGYYPAYGYGYGYGYGFA